MGKGRNNKTLKSWVTFVKKVQKEEGISYRDAMMRAKARKKEWQHGGEATIEMTETMSNTSTPLSNVATAGDTENTMTTSSMGEEGYFLGESGPVGGKKHGRKSKKAGRSMKRARTMRRSKSRSRGRR